PDPLRAALQTRSGPGTPLREYEIFALGTNEVDPVTIATTYATLAARGNRCAQVPTLWLAVASGVGARWSGLSLRLSGFG
ncbi:hypothetical protein, partial [Nonomuraea cypriaca]|uniref:hypothetical protein n=1 Tax=Nonomuraea cypriaca TaxID=1187855 RepID=UPI001A9C78C9